MAGLKIENLTPQQREVVELWGQGLAVLAGAGSGKTSTLVVKCAELMRRDPKACFAAVSFTEKSAADLEAKLSREISLRSHWVMTIHGLCARIIREFPEAAGFEGDERVLSEAEAGLLWQQSLDSLFSPDSPEAVVLALEKILSRESRSSLISLLSTLRSWESFGALKLLKECRESQGIETELELVASKVLERYRRSKLRQGVMDFEDMERGADLALSSPQVQQQLQKKFDLVLVDEFQDTNPTQAKIIWRLVRPDLSNLVVVGDPKQSIYRFRDADVSLFEELVQKLPQKRVLSWNFRSRPGIIDFVNKSCAPLFEASDLEFQALEPKREPAAEGQSPVLCLDVSSPEDLAVWIKQQVSNGVALSDMALLLRKIRGGNERWLLALNQAGIPLAVGSGGRFWEDPRVRELASLLRAWQQPHNSLSAAIFLRAPWVAVADSDIDVWARHLETRQRLLEKFFEDQEQHPIARLLSPLRAKIIRPGEILLALMADPRLESLLGNALLGLWHRCEEWSSQGWSFLQISKQLEKALNQGLRDRDLPPPRQLGQLTVLTVHGSKGLEFPHVLLLDLAGKSRAAHSPPLYWDRQRGIYLVARSPDGQRDDRSAQAKSWKELERRKDLAESKRVFYVALTRAKERLILVHPPRKSAKEENYKEAIWSEENWRGWCAIAEKTYPLPRTLVSEADKNADQSDSHQRLVVPAARPKAKQMAFKRSRHSVSEWNLLSQCPRAYEYRYIRPPALTAPTIDSAKSEQEISAADLGTRVHLLLEKQDREGLRALESELGSEVFQAGPLEKWLKESPLSHELGQSLSEMAFEIPVLSGDGDVVVGSIDRLVWNAATAKATIIDYKVNRRARTADALIHSYQTQMMIYAWALARLEPEVKELQTHLVQISPNQVKEISIPLPPTREVSETLIRALLEQANRIIQGEASEARVSSRCSYCDFRGVCPEGGGALRQNKAQKRRKIDASSDQLSLFGPNS